MSDDDARLGAAPAFVARDDSNEIVVKESTIGGDVEIENGDADVSQAGKVYHAVKTAGKSASRSGPKLKT